MEKSVKIVNVSTIGSLFFFLQFALLKWAREIIASGICLCYLPQESLLCSLATRKLSCVLSDLFFVHQSACSSHKTVKSTLIPSSCYPHICVSPEEENNLVSSLSITWFFNFEDSFVSVVIGRIFPVTKSYESSFWISFLLRPLSEKHLLLLRGKFYFSSVCFQTLNYLSVKS